MGKKSHFQSNFIFYYFISYYARNWGLCIVGKCCTIEPHPSAGSQSLKKGRAPGAALCSVVVYRMSTTLQSLLLTTQTCWLRTSLVLQPLTCFLSLVPALKYSLGQLIAPGHFPTPFFELPDSSSSQPAQVFWVS